MAESPASILALLANATETIHAHSYAEMHPAVSNFWMLTVFVLGTFIVGTITGNYSQVDRLWSITPAVFIANYAVVASLRGYEPKKGGYNWKDEDYRWPFLRTIITSPVLWHLFSFFFISLYQNLLLYLITLPAKTGFDVLAVSGGVDGHWGVWDSVAVILFVSLLVLETVADQQQWIFQETKWAMIKSGKKLEELPAPYNVGFLTTGLFAYSRHPNFFAEFSQWWAIYLFSVGANGQFNVEAFVGAFLLTLLFFGSAPFTEYITAQKYPLYKVYQSKVSMLVPWLPLRDSGER